jgi:hypothetical protein
MAFNENKGSSRKGAKINHQEGGQRAKLKPGAIRTNTISVRRVMPDADVHAINHFKFTVRR